MAGEGRIKLQSAIEYLTTYGWAIIIISALLVIFYEMGFFNFYNLTAGASPGSCRVYRPYGPNSTSYVSLQGACTDQLPQFIAKFSGHDSSIFVPNLFPKPVCTMTVTAWSYDSGMQSNSIGGVVGGCSTPGCVSADAQPPGGYVGIGYNDSSAVFIIGNASLSTKDTEFGNFKERWTFAAMVLNNGVATTYINGALRSSFSDGVPSCMNTTIWQIGNLTSMFPQATYFNGTISNVQVYNSSLTANDIQTIYTDGLGGKPLDLYSLVVWYPLNGNGYDYSGDYYNGSANNVGFLGSWYNTYSPISGATPSGGASNIIASSITTTSTTSTFSTSIIQVQTFFLENGLPLGVTWNAIYDNILVGSSSVSTNTIMFSTDPGDYAYAITNQIIGGIIYVPTPSNGTATAGNTIQVSFSQTSTTTTSTTIPISVSTSTSSSTTTTILGLLGCGTTCPTGVIACIPVNIVNSQSSATPTDFQIMFNALPVNALKGNVLVYNGLSGKTLPSWVENSTIIWTNLEANTIASSSSANGIYYIGVGASGTNFFISGNNIGEAPQWSCSNPSAPASCSGTYGQYDNGDTVFSFYDNFAGQTLNTKWTQYGSEGTPRSLTDIIVNNGLQLIGSSGVSGYSNTYIWASGITSAEFTQNIAADVLGNTVTNTDMFRWGFTDTVPTNFASYNAIGVCVNAGTLDVNTCKANVSTIVYAGAVPIDQYDTFTIAASSSIAYYYVNSYTIPSTSLSITYPSFSSNIALGLSSGTSNVFVQWVRTRAYPPGGVMPSITYQTSTTSSTCAIPVSTTSTSSTTFTTSSTSITSILPACTATQLQFGVTAAEGPADQDFPTFQTSPTLPPGYVIEEQGQWTTGINGYAYGCAAPCYAGETVYGITVLPFPNDTSDLGIETPCASPYASQLSIANTTLTIPTSQVVSIGVNTDDGMEVYYKPVTSGTWSNVFNGAAWIGQSATQYGPVAVTFNAGTYNLAVMWVNSCDGGLQVLSLNSICASGSIPGATISTTSTSTSTTTTIIPYTACPPGSQFPSTLTFSAYGTLDPYTNNWPVYPENTTNSDGVFGYMATSDFDAINSQGANWTWNFGSVKSGTFNVVWYSTDCGGSDCSGSYTNFTTTWYASADGSTWTKLAQHRFIGNNVWGSYGDATATIQSSITGSYRYIRLNQYSDAPGMACSFGRGYVDAVCFNTLPTST